MFGLVDFKRMNEVRIKTSTQVVLLAISPSLENPVELSRDGIALTS
jgi:hypothetical protein